MRAPSRAWLVAPLALSVGLAGSAYAAVALPAKRDDAPQLGRAAITTLPSGRTLRGVYFVGSSSAAGNQLATGEISFPIELARAPAAHFVRLGAARPAACQGSAVRPTARRGHLCVYEARESQASEQRVVDPLSGRSGGLVRVWGAGIVLRSIRGGDVYSAGSWAVTAP